MENKAANSPYRLTVKADYMSGGYRHIDYQVEKVDGKGNLHPLSKKDPQFHVTEHQTEHMEGTHSFGQHDNRSNDSVDQNGPVAPKDYKTNQFNDMLGPGFGQAPVTSGQSFTISTSPGLDPSDSQPILVRIPGSAGPGQTDDHGVMKVSIVQSGVTVNDTDKLTH